MPLESGIELSLYPSFRRRTSFLTIRVQLQAARYLPQLRPHASGLSARSVLDKFATVQMLDVHIPTTDGRELILTRYTEPERELKLLLERLNLELPAQPPPKITAAQTHSATLV